MPTEPSEAFITFMYLALFIHKHYHGFNTLSDQLLSVSLSRVLATTPRGGQKKVSLVSLKPLFCFSTRTLTCLLLIHTIKLFQRSCIHLKIIGVSIATILIRFNKSQRIYQVVLTIYHVTLLIWARVFEFSYSLASQRRCKSLRSWNVSSVSMGH